MEVVVGLYNPKTNWFRIVRMSYTRKLKLTYQKAEESIKVRIRDREFEVLGVRLSNGVWLIDPLPQSLIEYLSNVE